jgi:6-phosphogluconolactonase (cycloisomerase 2 family)
MTNAANGNKVLMFARAEDGSLSGMQEFSTGRIGTGGGLGNQGGLILSPNQQYLFAVNAGSNSVTIFELASNSLRRTDIFSSRGTRPIGLTMHGNLLYVLNAGSDDIFGFRINPHDTASPLSGSRGRLSGVNTGPAQIQFNTQGDALLVTEKNTNLIDIFSLGVTGRPVSRQENPSAGQTPFGFAVGPRNLINVSEAFGGTVGASALSSYRLAANGTLQTVSPTVGTTQTAACWVALGESGRFAYTTKYRKRICLFLPGSIQWWPRVDQCASGGRRQHSH